MTKINLTEGQLILINKYSLNQVKKTEVKKTDEVITLLEEMLKEKIENSKEVFKADGDLASVNIWSLKPDDKNSREDKNFLLKNILQSQVFLSLKEYGQLQSLVIDNNGVVLSGNRRLLSMRLLNILYGKFEKISVEIQKKEARILNRGFENLTFVEIFKDFISNGYSRILKFNEKSVKEVLAQLGYADKSNRHITQRLLYAIVLFSKGFTIQEISDLKQTEISELYKKVKDLKKPLKEDEKKVFLENLESENSEKSEKENDDISEVRITMLSELGIEFLEFLKGKKEKESLNKILLPLIK